MDVALRPYLTAGIAVIGAGVIAATPVTPLRPASPAPAVQLAADFVVADLTNPVDVYSALVTNTFNSIADLGGHWLGDPYPDSEFTVPLITLGTAALHPMQNLVSVINDIGNALTSGDLLGAAGALVAAPGSIADAVVNGYPELPGTGNASIAGGLLGDTIDYDYAYHPAVITHFPSLISYFTDYLPQLVLHELGLGDLIPGSAASTLSALSPEGLLDGLADGLNLGNLLDFNWLTDMLAMVAGALGF